MARSISVLRASSRAISFSAACAALRRAWLRSRASAAARRSSLRLPFGASLVALFLARYQLRGTQLSLVVAVGFALGGAALSMLRLSPAGARGGEHVRVHDGQRLKGD